MNARAYSAVFATDTVSVACHGYRILPRNCCSSISLSKLPTPWIHRWRSSSHG